VELEPHDSITVGSGEKTVQYAVSSVVSDEHVKLSTPALEELIEWTEFRAMPHIDQNKVYHAVHQRLRRGECCAIFPEGGSHDRSQLLPLKAGVAIMALGALAEDPSLDLKVVPCGLNYFNAHRFRSRAVVE
jgi:glycerol-3-phosphate O-acyltransferase/dihydroxyacetone phosphate acyltransferase